MRMLKEIKTITDTERNSRAKIEYQGEHYTQL